MSTQKTTGQEENDIYIIPPNFIDTGTVFGGTLKLRNAIEAAVVAVAIGVPVFRIPVSLTTKIIILCVTALPVALLALIGVDGESFSSFIFNFFSYLKKKRIVGEKEEEDTGKGKAGQKEKRKKQNKLR